MLVDAMSKYPNCNSMSLDGSNVVSNYLHEFMPTWPMKSNGDQLHQGVLGQIRHGDQLSLRFGVGMAMVPYIYI